MNRIEDKCEANRLLLVAKKVFLFPAGRRENKLSPETLAKNSRTWDIDFKPKQVCWARVKTPYWQVLDPEYDMGDPESFGCAEETHVFPVKAYHSQFSLTIIQKLLPYKQQIPPSEFIPVGLRLAIRPKTGVKF